MKSESSYLPTISGYFRLFVNTCQNRLLVEGTHISATQAQTDNNRAATTSCFLTPFSMISCFLTSLKITNFQPFHSHHDQGLSYNLSWQLLYPASWHLCPQLLLLVILVHIFLLLGIFKQFLNLWKWSSLTFSLPIVIMTRGLVTT